MDRSAALGALLVIVIGGGVLIALVAVAQPAAAPPAAPTWVGEGIWETRGMDLAGQALLVLAGVFGVLLVLGREAPR